MWEGREGFNFTSCQDFGAAVLRKTVKPLNGRYEFFVGKSG